MIINERVGMVVNLCHKIGNFQTEWLPQKVDRSQKHDCVGYFPITMLEPKICTKNLVVTLLKVTDIDESTTVREISVADKSRT